MTERHESKAVALRCGFCLELNEIDISQAEARPACQACGKPYLLDRPLKVSQEDFDQTVLAAAVPVMVDFYADWCAPCKMVAPLMDEIAHQQTGKMLVVKVDTDGAPAVAERYGIRSIPTIVVFVDGEETNRSLGFEPERLRGFVEEALT